VSNRALMPRGVILWYIFSMICGTAGAAPRARRAPVDWVNPYIGTAGGGTEYGGMMPLVTTPFGMTNWTPQTRQNLVSVNSYAYEDNQVSGFIGTHQPAIWMGDYGYVTLMPEVGNINVQPESRKLRFSHADEIATPYYYSVSMKAGSHRTIKAEMTATDHCALLRFTYPQNPSSSVLVEATRPGIVGFVRIDPKSKEISGYNPDRQDAQLGPFPLPNFKGYFVVQFSKTPDHWGIYRNTRTEFESMAVEDKNVGAFASFHTVKDEVIQVRVGTSFISIDQARESLKKEIPFWDFESLKSQLKEIWNRKLGIASIEGATEDQSQIFYTGLYHALLYPRLFSEHGKYYSAFDDTVHDGVSYTDYSIWDTFRAENSLITIFASERVDDMITALLQNYKEGGWMPKWPNPSYTNIMIGTHADSLVAEAINKGFHGFDYSLAYQSVYKDATTPPDGDTTRRWFDREPHTPYEARAGLTWLKEVGYVPVDKTAEAASSTLEDSYDDWCVAQVAKALGKSEDYQFFLNRSRNYRFLFNPATGFMQGKNYDGSWADPGAGWTEGDKWAYTWAVMQDMPGLVSLMGGRAVFNAKLDELFRGGHNVHSNEPSHHYAYLYDFSGQPWKTQAKVRQIATRSYSSRPDGIDGNEDCGQMSAWYIFTAMGFYPVNPASAEYMIGSPLFRRITLNLLNGNRFVIAAVNNSASNLYIQSAKLNGKPLADPVIRYTDIEKGGTLEFVMGRSPSTWGSGWKPVPLPELDAPQSRP
jgi:predicted alpha-1,2-mannosidase